LVRGNWIKPGAAIIDVGINPVDVSNLVLIFPC
jgi:5,10-methylene-tetrahydrofolate dehydrogenase/methenyl tetrahydrofolate cyclohydrolase